MFTDPIADMLTRIRNATRAQKLELVLPYSKFKSKLGELLVKEGFVTAVKEVTDKHKMLQVNLKYSDRGDGACGGNSKIEEGRSAVSG